MSTIIKTIQVASIFTALTSAGGIATLSLFDVPELQSQPASRSLPLTRWLFSRGSHIFPTAAVASSIGFGILAYRSLPAIITQRGIVTALLQLLKVTANNFQVSSYVAASALTFSIGPFTQLVMVPTNFRLIELNEAKGGSRSAKAARESESNGGLTAEDSVDSKGMPSQYTDLSLPQTRTKEETSESEDREVRELLGRFGVLNSVRAVLMGLGGVAGLLAALA